jgi:uncharacterized damage-inducible protein DinB
MSVVSGSPLDAMRIELRRYLALLEGALSQVDDASFEREPAPGTNSIATILVHLTGNLRSRFTDFLTSDGEKPWRDRDSEFAPPPRPRRAVQTDWGAAAELCMRTFESLVEADLERRITIRGVELTVAEALARSVAHLAYHTGQVVLLARCAADEATWRSLSIPRGGSAAYNRAPGLEKGPR